MSLFNNKYRIETTRLKDFDYSSVADYYVTINLKKRTDFFGSIKDCKMKLNNAGLIAQAQWLNLPLVFNNIKLGEYVIMPEHMHGIISVLKQTGKTLSNFIQVFKSKTAVIINKTAGQNEKCIWQNRFYDRVIRDDKEYYFVEEYILNNPLKTDPDNYYKEWFELQEMRDKNQKKP